MKRPRAYCALFKSYLKNRLIPVKYKDECSKLGQILAGVLQESILHPLLYVLYTSDIQKVAGTNRATFADDTTILSVARTENEATHRIQNTLTCVLE